MLQLSQMDIQKRLNKLSQPKPIRFSTIHFNILRLLPDCKIQLFGKPNNYLEFNDADNFIYPSTK